MKTPSFWSSKTFLSTLLVPVSIIYDMIGTLSRAKIRPAAFPVPIICIGNLTAGGAGKTPVALYIGERLKAKNINAYFLSRGYGGRLEGPVLVKPEKHKAADVGDEPLLLAELLPTVVAKDRVSGANYAITKGAKAIIMDDGFQNRSIIKSLSLLVIDGFRGFGNGRLIPAGPLRERPEDGFKRAHAVIVINRTTTLPKLPTDRPAFFARTYPKDAANFKGKKLFAFCGIAYPQKFFEMLRTTGAKVVEEIAFADHYQYTALDLRKLLLKSYVEDALLITTSKDYARLPEQFRDSVAVMELGIEFENPAIFDSVLDYIVKPNENA